MNLTAFQKRQCVKSLAAVLVIRTQDRKGDQHLVSVQTRVLAVKISDLRLLDRLDEPTRNEFDTVVDPGQMLGGLEEKGGARSEKVRGLRAQNCPV